MNDPSIARVAHNVTKHTTILLLHGGFSSHREWDLVVPHLSDYHLLVPDLPSHADSWHLRPFSVPFATSLLADLIRKEAKNGKAHVVGLSLGGYVALHLAEHHPELVETVVVTGCGKTWHDAPVLTAVAPYIFWISVVPLAGLPRSLFTRLCRLAGLEVPEGLQSDMWTSTTFELGRQIARSLAASCKPTGLRARTLAIAGAVNDSVKEVGRLGRVLKEGNEESEGVKVDGMRHSWNLQAPELFAIGVKKWTEKGELPNRFVKILA